MFVLPTALRGVSVLFAVLLVISVQGADAEQTPPENIRGQTYNGGPTNVFDRGEKKTETKKEEVKKDEKKHEEKKHEEKKHEEKEHKSEKEKKSDKKDEKKEDKKASVESKSTPAEAGKPASSTWGDSALTLLNFPEDKAAAPALTQQQADAKYRHAVAMLCTSGWREAQDELIRGSKTSVPYLLEAMSKTENAYHNGGHTKADASRALRQRPLSEVCVEILRTIVTTRSNYKGELPGSDAQAWQTWFSTQGSSITFAN